MIGLCLGYAATLLYSSTIVGPAGCNFVYRDPVVVLQQFLVTRWVEHGSDQRADWIGNLLMLVPFGFLVTAVVWPRRTAFKPAVAIAAVLVCAGVILVIKYLQLFFPPRTVTLNYIVAQGVGAAIGCAGFAAWKAYNDGAPSRTDPIAALVLGLRLYCAALLIFLLMPLDFALNVPDLLAQAERLPDAIMTLPGDGRPLAVRVILIAAASAAFIPVGMMLAFVRIGVYRVRRPPAAILMRGLVITTGVFAVSTLVMGATPVAVSILYRTFGVMVGAGALRWLVRQDMARLRYTLRGLVRWTILPYLLVVVLVNRLASVHWLSPHEAIAQADPLGLMPLFDYYIVSKATAARNIAGHILLYMPVGAAVWLRRGPRGQRSGGWLALVLAAGLSFIVELGRYFRPGLEGDINSVAVAGLAALFTVRLMPAVWSMLTILAAQSTRPLRRWNLREQPVSAGSVARPVGEIERSRSLRSRQ